MGPKEPVGADMYARYTGGITCYAERYASSLPPLTECDDPLSGGSISGLVGIPVLAGVTRVGPAIPYWGVLET